MILWIYSGHSENVFWRDEFRFRLLVQTKKLQCWTIVRSPDYARRTVLNLRSRECNCTRYIEMKARDAGISAIPHRMGRPTPSPHLRHTCQAQLPAAICCNRNITKQKQCMTPSMRLILQLSVHHQQSRTAYVSSIAAASCSYYVWEVFPNRRYSYRSTILMFHAPHFFPKNTRSKAVNQASCKIITTHCRHWTGLRKMPPWRSYMCALPSLYRDNCFPFPSPCPSAEPQDRAS